MKKNNYNWNLNPDNLSPEEIAKHKDFEALLKQVTPAQQTEPPHKAPVYRRLLYIGGAVAAAFIGFLLYTGGMAGGDTPTVSFDEFAASQPYVNPPIDKVEKVFASKTVEVNKGGVFEYENGSKVTVPEAAFTDRYGNLAVGNVDIKYKEYHDYVDFFLSGIPLEYDSAGTKYFLESAGMVEIYAEQNGQRLNIAPGKTLNVELVSTINLKKGEAVPSFNIYSLDTENRNWVYEGIDNIEVINEASAVSLLSEEDEIEKAFQQEITSIERKEANELAAIEKSIPLPVEPFKPKKKNNSDEAFNFDIEADKIQYGSEVPTAAQAAVRDAERDLIKLKETYKNTIWQVAPSNGPYEKQAIRSIVWDDMTMKHLKNQDYKLTLIKGEKTLSLTVNPVLNGDDYEAALAKFNQEQAAYTAKLDERKAALAEKKQTLKTAIDREKALAEAGFQEQIAAYKAAGEADRATDIMVQTKILNRFSVGSLGIWNCDRPIPPSAYMVKGDFIAKDQTQFEGNIAYLVNKERNSVARFYTQKGTRVDFNMNAEHLLWLITKENKIAVYTPEDFKKIDTKRGEHTFVMNVVDRQIETEEDVRQILDF